MKTLRDALSASWDAAETEEDAPAPADVSDAPPSKEAPEVETSSDDASESDVRSAIERARDDAGRFAKNDKKAPKATPPAKDAAAPEAPPAPIPAPPSAQAEEAPPAAASQAESYRAPPAWRAAAREHWAKLPAEVQAEVNRREKTVAQTLQETVAARKLAESFEQTIAPYRMLFTDEPVKVVGSLVQTVAQLQTGTAQQRAAIVANIIKSYGVDVEQLAATLEGQPQAQGQGTPQQGQYADPRVDQLLAQMQQAKVQREAAQRQSVAQQAQDFAAKAEFFEDVRDDMADIIESAARRGVTMTLEDAYNRACRMNDGVWPVIQQREKAKAANVQAASTQRARAAASSIKSQPAGTTAPAGNDLRSMLEAAWDESSGR